MNITIKIYLQNLNINLFKLFSKPLIMMQIISKIFMLNILKTKNRSYNYNYIYIYSNYIFLNKIAS